MSLFWLGLAYNIAQHLVVIFLGNVYSFLISWKWLMRYGHLKFEMVHVSICVVF